MLGRHRVVSEIKGKGAKRPQRSMLLLSVACKFLLSLISLLQPTSKKFRTESVLRGKRQPSPLTCKEPGNARVCTAVRCRPQSQTPVLLAGPDPGHRAGKQAEQSLAFQCVPAV